MDSITYNFCSEKNAQLMSERGICFEDIIIALGDGNGLDVLEHPNKEKYPNQKIFVVDLDGCAYIVPFVEEDNNALFLKTIFPSRKMTKVYLGGG